MKHRNQLKKTLAVSTVTVLAVTGLTACSLPFNLSSGNDSGSDTTVQVNTEAPSSALAEGTTEETGQEFVADVVLDKEDVDTASMIPVEYTCSAGSIGLYIPQDWTYNIDSYQEDQGTFSITIHPSDEEEGELVLEWFDTVDLGTDGVTEVGASMYGYDGYLGSYGNESWDYFRLINDYDHYVVLNTAVDFWYTDQEETVGQILSTVKYGEPLIAAGEKTELGEAYEVFGKDLTVTTDEEDGGSLYVSYGDEQLELTDYCTGTRENYLLRYDDEKAYVLVQALADNDYVTTYFLKLSASGDQTLQLLDTLNAGISETEGVTASGLALSFRVECLGTYQASRHYGIYEDQLVTNDALLHIANASGEYMEIWDNTADMDGESLDSLSMLYTEDGRMCLTLKTDLEAYTSGEEEITIPSGTQICPTDIDPEQKIFYFDFMQYDETLGEYLTNYGYIKYETDENGYNITINGENPDDLFESIPYAG